MTEEIPFSGIVVNYEDQGETWFIDASTGSAVAEFTKWDERYSPETIANQLNKARSARTRILLLELWLPGGFVMTGAGWSSVWPADVESRIKI